MSSGRLTILSEIFETVKADLREDRRLRYVLLLALLLSGFWFWWRSPNFATADEYGRLLRPMKAGGEFAADPSYSAFVRGATDGVPQGASFYLYAITLLPAGLIVLLTGKLDEFGSYAGFTSRWDLWHAVPEWFWHATILSARIVNVLLAVACVYVVYRIGTAAWNRRAGIAGALMLTLTLAFLASAHEADEDTAMILALLATVYLALRYAQSGTRSYAYWGAFAGGVAISFKLTAGTTVFVLLAALVVRTLEDTDESLEEITGWLRDRFRFVGSLAAIGAATIYVGRPHVLLEGPGALLLRATAESTKKSGETSATAQILGYDATYALVWAVGLPLAIALVGAVAWHTNRLRQRRSVSPLPTIVLPALAVYVLVFGTWTSIKAHHVLPMIVLGVVLLGYPLSCLSRPDANRASRVLVAVLVVTTAAFAGVGTMSFATEPRDEAAEWMAANAGENDSVLVYQASVADVGVVHGQSIEHYDFVEEVGVSDQVENESAQTEWIVSSPEREPEYIMVTASGASYVDQPVEEAEYPRRAKFFKRLVAGDHFGYEIAAEFGEMSDSDDRATELLEIGIDPSVEKQSQYVLILRHPDA